MRARTQDHKPELPEEKAGPSAFRALEGCESSHKGSVGLVRRKIESFRVPGFGGLGDLKVYACPGCRI